jgi:hypothetical protein
MHLNFHENLTSSEAIRCSSDRSFGLVFAAILTALGLWPLLRAGQVRILALGVAGVFLVVSLFRPALLHPLNKAWMALGLLMAKIVNPIVMATLFLLIFTPAAVISRWLGRDPLRLKPSPEAETYWIVRQPPGPPPHTMSKQF